MTLEIRLDHCPMHGESPCGDDGTWKIYSFGRKHSSAFELKNCKYSSIDEILPEGKVPLWLRRKLNCGTAFFLDYYEHGDGCWSRTGTGPQCQFDNVRCAGIAIWEEPVTNMGAKTKEERAKDLDNELTVYNDWMNGHTYQYSIESDDGFEDSCGGFIGSDDLVQMVNEAISHRPVDEEINFSGDCRWIADYHKIAGKVSREEWDAQQALINVGAGV